MADIRSFLESLGLLRYEQVFIENEIEPRDLAELTESDLQKLGLPMGPRKRILRAVGNSAAKPAEESGPAAAVPNDSASLADTSGDAERRHLTVMFVDLVGSTALSGQLDPEDLRELTLAYQNTVAGEITRFEGYVARYMGDGVLAYFGWPRAHEDDAERAVRAGLAVTEAVARLRTPSAAALSTRTGLATGIVVVGDLIGEGGAQEQAVVGETPNLAARLQGLAEPGSVFISEQTRRLLGGLFNLQVLGTKKLKGIAEGVNVYRVLGECSIESRYHAHRTGAGLPMMGRQHELALLEERWRQSRRGEGQMVLLTGEAGIGKSRILGALDDAMRDQAYHRVVYQCSPYHTASPLYPVIQQLTRSAGIAENDNAGKRHAKLAALPGLTPTDPTDRLSLLASLLEPDRGASNVVPPLDAREQRARVLQALVDLIAGLTRTEPVLLVVEDAHWIDPTTMDLIEQMADAIADLPVLLLITARPEFEHRFGAYPRLARLELGRLGRDPSLAIIDRVAAGKRLPPEVEDEILRKTDGVPLFIEELTKTVLETGQLREVAGTYVLDGPLGSIDIPGSLRGSLMARLDRLQTVREVTQVAACIGREFSYRLLAEVAHKDESVLRDALDALVRSELVFGRGSPPEAVYTFKHALVRDAAYDSLLRKRRQQIHGRLLASLQARPDAVPEILARHAIEARRDERAVEFLQLAAERAIQRSANVEAVSQLGQAIELLRRQPEGAARDRLELDLQIAIAAPLIATDGFTAPRVIEANSRAYDLCLCLEDTPNIIPALCNLQRYYIVSADVQGADEGSAELQRVREEFSAMDPAWTAIVDNGIGVTAMIRGDFSTAVHYLRTAVDESDPAHRERQIVMYGEDLGVTAGGFLAAALWFAGYPDQALRAQSRAEERAAKYSHAFSIAWINTQRISVPLYQSDVERLLAQASDNHAFAVEHELTAYEGLNRVYRAYAMAKRERTPSATDRLIEAIATLEDAGLLMNQARFRVLLADALLAAGQIESALSVVDEAIGYSEEGGEAVYRAEAHRLRGDVLRRLPGPGSGAEAEASYRRSLDVARRQRARGWELRAATSLARLLSEQDQREEARDVLAPVYRWFTEGFDTADLQAADALLGGLA